VKLTLYVHASSHRRVGGPYRLHVKDPTGFVKIEEDNLPQGDVVTVEVGGPHEREIYGYLLVSVMRCGARMVTLTQQQGVSTKCNLVLQ
jgi:hypothetical protein